MNIYEYFLQLFQNCPLWLQLLILLPIGWVIEKVIRFGIQKWLSFIVKNFKKKIIINLKSLKSFNSPLKQLLLPSLYLFFIHFLDFSSLPKVHSFILMGLKVWIAFSLLLFINPLCHFFIGWIYRRFYKETDPMYLQFLDFIKKITTFSLYIVTALLIFQNFGYDVTSLIAGLGIGGLAVALAAKDTLSNIFGSIVILFDKPFVKGDWIHFDKTEGIVEGIGFRSTQIKTFYDSVISVPNSVISNTTIDNLGKRKARRTRLTLGVVYSTPASKIESFVEGIKQIIENNPKTKKNYYQVSFSGFSNSSLDIFINMFLIVKDWDEELKERQVIYLSILKLAEQMKVNFAFPSQSIYLENKSNEK